MRQELVEGIEIESGCLAGDTLVYLPDSGTYTRPL